MGFIGPLVRQRCWDVTSLCMQNEILIREYNKVARERMLPGCIWETVKEGQINRKPNGHRVKTYICTDPDHFAYPISIICICLPNAMQLFAWTYVLGLCVYHSHVCLKFLIWHQPTLFLWTFKVLYVLVKKTFVISFLPHAMLNVKTSRGK